MALAMRDHLRAKRMAEPERADFLRRKLLEAYGKKAPVEFVQYDGFNPPSWPVGPGSEDEDGDELWASRSWELMSGSNCRVFVRPDAPPHVAARLLRKIADWIERDGLYDSQACRGYASGLLRKVEGRR